MRQPLPLLLLLCLASVSQAHDLWLEADGNDYLLLQGHRHAHAHAHVHAESETESKAYDAAQVTHAVCVDAAGARREWVPEGISPVRLTGPCAVLWVRFATGYWTKTAWETKNVPKTGLSGVLRSWHAQESVKRIGQWTEAAAQPLGLGLEMTPLSNPLNLKSGDTLRLRITDAGQPLAGVPVTYGHARRGVSGPDGEISIRLRQAGVQLLSTRVEAPLHDDKADVSQRSATLQFEIAR